MASSAELICITSGAMALRERVYVGVSYMSDRMCKTEIGSNKELTEATPVPVSADGSHGEHVDLTVRLRFASLSHLRALTAPPLAC